MRYILLNRIFTASLLTLSLHVLLFSAGPYSKIPFEKSSGLLLVKASVNGVEGKMIFDTAADHLLINDAVSGASSHNNYITLTGEAASQKMKVKSLAIGEFHARDITAYKTDLSLLEKHVGENILGILGAGLLEGELIRINIAEGIIEILPRKEFYKSQGHYKLGFPVSFENRIPVVELQMGGKAFRFVLDTGSSVSIINSALLNRYQDLFNKTNRQFNLLTAASEMENAYYYTCSSMSIAGKFLNMTELGVLDMTDINTQFDKPVDGILSLEDLPFHSIVVDNTRGWIFVDQL